MARSNFNSNKRRKELARKLKQEEKRMRRADKKSGQSDTEPNQNIETEEHSAPNG